MRDHTVLVIADPTEPRLGLLEPLRANASLVTGLDADAFRTAAPDAGVIFNWALNNATLKELLAMCPKLRWVHIRAAGLDNMLFPELVESPALVTNGSGVFSQSLGEFALAAMLHFAKDLRRMISNQEAGKWEQFDVEELSNRTVGIVGYGDIGCAVASRARAMGMRVLALKRHPSVYRKDGLADQIFGPGKRIEMLSQCDYVVAAAPLTPETRGMIGEPEFAAMKPSAVVINVGRGPVIDEASLIRALQSGRIKGAGLDVFDVEPLPAGHPFYSMKNVLLSPHTADHTATWLDDAMRFFVTQFQRFAKGEPLANIVEKKLGY
jgi:phosphoglycerate dehydrogenase-like enzyme